MTVIQLVNLNSVLNFKAILEFGKLFKELKDILGVGKEGRILCIAVLLSAPCSFLA